MLYIFLIFSIWLYLISGGGREILQTFFLTKRTLRPQIFHIKTLFLQNDRQRILGPYRPQTPTTEANAQRRRLRLQTVTHKSIYIPGQQTKWRINPIPYRPKTPTKMEAKTTNVSHKTLFFQHDSHNEGLSQTIPIKKHAHEKRRLKPQMFPIKTLLLQKRLT